MPDRLAPLIGESTVHVDLLEPIGAMLPPELCQGRQRQPS
jgi:hypothetical protein